MAYLRDAFLKVKKTLFGPEPVVVVDGTKAFAMSLKTYNVYPCPPWTTGAYTQGPDRAHARKLLATTKIDFERSCRADYASLLMQAAEVGFSGLIPEMLQRGARIGAQNDRGDNAIHGAVSGFSGITSWYSPTSYDIGKKMPDLQTVVVLAEAATLEELTQKNNMGRTPLDVLRAMQVYGEHERNKNNIIDLLVQKIAEKEAAAKVAPSKPAAKSTVHKKSM